MADSIYVYVVHPLHKLVGVSACSPQTAPHKPVNHAQAQIIHTSPEPLNFTVDPLSRSGSTPHTTSCRSCTSASSQNASEPALLPALYCCCRICAPASSQNSREPALCCPCCCRVSASGSTSTAAMASRRRLFLKTYSVVSGSLGARVPAEGSLLMLSRAHALLGGRGEGGSNGPPQGCTQRAAC